jgi:hypothetical protein
MLRCLVCNSWKANRRLARALIVLAGVLFVKESLFQYAMRVGKAIDRQLCRLTPGIIEVMQSLQY